MESILSDFNTMIIELAAQLAIVCPTSIIGANINVIKTLVKNNPNTIIDIFIQHILKYKQQIDAEDDAFFMNNSFSSETQGDNNMISRVFEFKGIWKQLNQSNRSTVKQYMKILCQLALSYVNLIVTK